MAPFKTTLPSVMVRGIDLRGGETVLAFCADDGDEWVDWQDDPGHVPTKHIATWCDPEDWLMIEVTRNEYGEICP